MRKNITIVFGLLIALTIISGAWAQDIGGTDNRSGKALSFAPSPNVTIDAEVDQDAFTILSYSSKVDSTNGVEYSMISGDGYIYQGAMGETKSSLGDAGAKIDGHTTSIRSGS
nr:hypothetical protein [uncultured Desulfobacter sp.]